jgi:hypothetical protein
MVSFGEVDYPGWDLFFSGTALTATATSLLFDFDQTGGLFGFPDPTATILIGWHTPDIGGCCNFGSGTEVIATTTTPLPAALPLFATGLGGLGLLGWRRRRKAQAVP